MRRVEAFSAVVIVICALAVQASYRGRAQATWPLEFVERVPMSFVDWTGSPRVFNPVAYGLGSEADYVAREYVSPLLGSIDFLAVTAQNLGGLADPGLYLRTQGWKPQRTKTLHLGPMGDRGAEVFFSKVRKGATTICVAYWFESGGRGTPGVTKAQLSAYWEGLTSGKMRCPVSVYRVAATVVSDEDETENAVRTFVDELLDEMAAKHR
jgi:hypothetical protein